MRFQNLQVICFLAIFSSPAWAEAQKAPSLMGPEVPVHIRQCQENLKFSNVSFEDLKGKLTKTLHEKNKSLIFLEYRTLQAQVDLMVSHLMIQESYSANDSAQILEKILAQLDTLEELLEKAKKNARVLKEDHVVPLATLTSLKSDYDQCIGKSSQFSEIFRHLSQLNKDLNEILMISPQRILAQKDTVKSLLRKTESEATLSARNLSEPLNFIQNQINSVTRTFDFDTKTLNVASN